MKLFRIFLAGIAGTTAMTAFSYLVAEKKNKQFKEPQILNKLLKRMDFPLEVKSKHHFAGWILHYKVGIFFSLIYDLLWSNTSIKPSFKNSLIMGAITGLFGILIWELTFTLHPSPPKLDFRGYYRQLFVAHILFGLFARLGYQLPNLFVKEPVTLQK